MDIKNKKTESYEWAKIPNDLPKENLALITAKTSKATIHPEDPEYPVRLFSIEQLAERAASLAQRPIGVNHSFLIELSSEEQELTGSKYAFTVDAQWNKSESTIEALIYLPIEYIEKIRRKEVNKVSVEYTWRDEKRTDKGIEFEGFVFNRVDLLMGLNPGDSDTQIKLIESKRGLMEGIIKVSKEDKLVEDSETINEEFELPKELHKAALAYLNTLGEPFAGFTDWDACIRYAKKKGAKDPEAYCGYIKAKAEPKKKENLVESVVDDKKDISATQATQPTNPAELPESKQPSVANPPTAVPTQSDTGKTDIVQPVKPPEPVKEPPNPPIDPTQTPPTQTSNTMVTDVTPPDAKDVRITELEEAVSKLTKSVEEAETIKNKAIEEAVKAKEKEIIDKVEKTLPPPQIMSRLNRTGQRLAEDVRRVIYKAKKDE